MREHGEIPKGRPALMKTHGRPLSVGKNCITTDIVGIFCGWNMEHGLHIDEKECPVVLIVAGEGRSEKSCLLICLAPICLLL